MATSGVVRQPKALNYTSFGSLFECDRNRCLTGANNFKLCMRSKNSSPLRPTNVLSFEAVRAEMNKAAQRDNGLDSFQDSTRTRGEIL